MKFDGWLLEKKTDEAKAQMAMVQAAIDKKEEAEQAAFERQVAGGGGDLSSCSDESQLISFSKDALLSRSRLCSAMIGLCLCSGRIRARG